MNNKQLREEEITNRYDELSVELQRRLQGFYNQFMALNVLGHNDEHDRQIIRESIERKISEGKTAYPLLDPEKVPGDYSPSQSDLEYISELNTFIEGLNERTLDFDQTEAREAHSRLIDFLYGNTLKGGSE